MKLSHFSPIALAVSCTLFALSVNAAGTARENERLQTGKITKNEAEHLVQNAYPGAKIKNCELRSGKPHSVWVVEVVKAGSSQPIKVEVDGRTGKILKPATKQ